MKKFYYLLMLAFVLPLCVMAQQRTISGRVTDARDGSALFGVSVFVQGADGKRTGTTTNTKGEYAITFSGTQTDLHFSFVGMTELIEKINGRTTINASLQPNEEQLSSVVVVGYGTKRKETLTGAVSNITAKEIQTSTNVSLAQKLQGKVAGLQIRQQGGEPGTFDNSINIRGFGTPLYVIDGVARDGSSEFQRLNGEDIESISFLKDASAAIYGLRAANGVVIVTTKKGNKGKTSFNYNGVVGWMKPTDVPRMANAAEWIQMRNDAAVLGTGAPFLTKEEMQKYIDGAPGYESTDWYNETMKKQAMQQQHTFSASGGNEKTQFYIGLGYVNEEGLLKTNDMGYSNYTLRTNLVTELAKNLKAEVFISGRYDRRYVPGENFFNIFKGTRVTLPTEQPYANGNPKYPAVVTPSTQNPVVLSDKNITGYNETVNRNVQSSVALAYQVPGVQGLSLRAMGAFDLNSYANKDVSKPYKLYTYVNDQYIVSPQRVGTASISNSFGNNNRITWQAQANYNRQFNRAHNVSGTVVVEQQQFWSRDASLRRIYDFYTIDQINGASSKVQENSGIEGRTANLSFVGRFNYDYKGKYLIEFAFREDGSYRYHPDKKWVFFPVVTGGWRLSEENFFKEKLPYVSNLKLKASYGFVGEDAGDPFQYVVGYSTSGGGTYEFANGSLTNGASSPAIVNPQLSWVKSAITDFGIEIGLLNNKFNLEFDVYRRDRDGLLAYRNVSLPNTFGASLPQENLNSDRTQGFDFTVNYNNKVNDFSYGVSANFNYSRTMNRYVERGPFTNSYDKWRNGTANRWNDIVWGYTYQGQFQSLEEIATHPIQNGDQANIRELPGDFKYQDTNNDGVIDDRDMTPMFYGGSPKMFYGLTLNASYKGFDLNALFQGSGKYTVRFSEVYAEVLAFRGNTPAYFFDRWHKEDPYDPNSAWVPGKWPASRFNGDVGRMYAESSVWRKDASYVRLKSLELGYTFNNKLYKKAGINRIRIYANAFNVFTIADSFVKPFDPERVEGLFNAGFNYPLTKSYNFGVNVNF
ncbi:TonB-linked SusC/RagA family outer membrane protein [Chitinophaga skermanii]|uniref:TonB-linked SusC/RagA family outer membrane protein n=1 Tax=Chitinophaga skermanii TaxID=331697 RepID=A0A327QCM9_9BACT|nr:TonB-dependent receptor [Chitinophaga skermanii]RAJ02406.1 TonB-linked SusC/RagA family outer membrane protein [Chitinophaga skermanii]